MSYNHLTMDERNVIYRMQWQGYADAEIARCLGRHRSTIGRECRRNRSHNGSYHPGTAQTLANSRRRFHLRRPKTGHRRLMAYVADRLQAGWSPEQIAGRLSRWAPEGLEGLRISHMTIYRWIWGDQQRADQFRPFLRIARKPRRKPYGKPSRQGQILGKRSIDERPQEANERQRLGDWEGDTVVGKGRKGYLLTCVDRASRYLIARKVKTCASEPVAERLEQTIGKLPASKRHSLTLDNGREFARPVELERRLCLKIFFAHPYHAWERGTNENTNGLLRQYLPKDSDLSVLSPIQLRSFVLALNHRPRKCLGYQSPFEVFHNKSPG
ncbi:MAG: IS30 family transposase [Phycisphaerales bacterium]|nr:MAG: IS30 family transposase [Phycisphaerales bacterium]